MAAKKRGRKSKYSQARHGTIVEALRAGNFNEAACQAAGIDGSTFYRWLERGEEGEEPYATFRADVEDAQCEAEMRAVSGVERAADGLEETTVEEAWEKNKEGLLVLVSKKSKRTTSYDWRAAAWLLERRNAARWASRQRLAVDHSGEIKQTVIIHDGPAPHAEDDEADQ